MTSKIENSKKSGTTKELNLKISSTLTISQTNSRSKFKHETKEVVKSKVALQRSEEKKEKKNRNESS